MKAIVGLGNPGDEYKQTRHNAGFLTIDLLAEHLAANYWKDECGALVAHCKASNYGQDEVLLIKPQSFMNLSGGPVKNVLAKYDLSVKDLIIIHDDMDINSKNIKVKCGGSSAGHNGLKSITAKLGTPDYIRIRVGIDKAPGNIPYANYVLNIPKGILMDDFNEACQTASEAAIFLLNNTLDATQQKFNAKKA